MTNKIQELTDKIYKEGIDKANSDALQIINQAKKQAQNIIKSAEQQKTEIIENAEKIARENTANTNSELKLAARQFISRLKHQVTDMITTTQIKAPVQEVFKNSEFIKKMILTLIQNWNSRGTYETDLKILLPEKNEQELDDFLKSGILNSLNKTVEVQLDSNIENGFKIGPKNNEYILSFSDKDFENYFKDYLKERTRKFLFESNE